MDESNLPAPEAKPGFLEWLADRFGLPFALPKLALPQTIKNADKALGRLIAAGVDNVSGRIERNSAIRGGKTEAELKVIKAAASQLAAQSKTDPTLVERALEYTFGETVLKQKNREQVGRLALEHLNATAQPKYGHARSPESDATAEIDDDWLNAFSDHVSSKSDADIQTLWAKILANEIRKPRSFSLQSLRLLADLSADDARLLHDKILPLVVSGHVIFSEGLPDLTDFIRAQELGVVSGAAGIGLSWNVGLTPGSVLLPISGGQIVVNVPKETTVHIPAMMLTRFGGELLKLSNDYSPAPNDYVERLRRFFEGSGLKAYRIP
ncbi:DUF2806 domain-containing protein [Bradyrhizobium japonicum]|uniref:DUF2806 domain-containing protein n=1 Tax=Bradyrhizobium japonicum TaxID=375 RepID=UPI00130DC32B|nr:DUF2806 domain-containing protein [Bradyrhizobium japonicum]MCD9107154.1 DUF2806 domain-containing protein [Bradyrhizobium japonicum]MCD9256874.1 DUF2806 domain-containing protein [Bradyrhizobium japonicum SEMIA 5079]MCD9818951.1 DUF2806 domain-containing protein [Bradyrhizobium japonicum]MCD9889845.1 DUF2806 domain-containing protein [Bradyrhizobium japonicum]MCD9906114.1 DUF2806 domain-containing protein [Bradyrhizobium japonicum]